tara:strand:+ start:2249 stop:3046 length:798 start_codon:yes stop_codon:yes gene_type:complete
MKQSESIAALAAALAKSQMQIQPALKNTVNPYFKSHYANLEAVWEACREPLNKNGLSVVQFPCDGDAGRIGLCTILMHLSGEWMSEVVTTRAVKDDPQGLGSALTYLRRYSLAAVVGICATEDDDGNAASATGKLQATAQVEHVRTQQPVASEPRKIQQPLVQSTSGIDYVTAVIDFVKIDTGIGKTGKPYTKYRIGFNDVNGDHVFGTTFSTAIGDDAQRSKAGSLSCNIGYTIGQFGIDIKTLELDASSGPATQPENEDDLPF